MHYTGGQMSGPGGAAGKNEDEKMGEKFDGSAPDQLKMWKQTIMANLLSTQKKDGRFDTSTWGSYILARCRGEAAELFEEVDIEEAYAIEGGHKLVWKELVDTFPFKEEADRKQEVLREKREFRRKPGEKSRDTIRRFKKLSRS